MQHSLVNFLPSLASPRVDLLPSRAGLLLLLLLLRRRRLAQILLLCNTALRACAGLLTINDVCVSDMYNSRLLRLPAIMMLAHHSGRVAQLPPTAHALVIGGSGAVGRCVVAQLAADQAISKITCINRRDWALPALSIGDHKLHHVTCNIESEQELSQAVSLLADQSVSVAYCTLGTTRR